MSNTLKTLIEEEITAKGAMTFARFMELALYHPEHGYYAREDISQNIGKKGDFFTSVSVGGLFGKLLANQFHAWWMEMGKPKSFQIVECGGFDGTLACDILSAFQQNFPECFRSVQYVLVEPLTCLAGKQKTNLSSFANVIWKTDMKDVGSVEGIIFGNELLDAFPVHVLENQSGEWMEMRVVVKPPESNPSQFCHPEPAEGSPSSDEQRFLSREIGIGMTSQKNPGIEFTWTEQSCLRSLSNGLPSTYRGRLEICPMTTEWLRTVSALLKRGKILLIDYGYTDEEYFEVARPEGTLRGYRDHRLVEDVLLDPGEQDITAHVRWSMLIRVAEESGLKVEEFIQQSRWLTRILVRGKMELPPAEIRQFQSLTHPEILGEPFRVLVLTPPK